MNDLLNAFFSLNGMLIFFLGVAAACGWHYFKMRFIGKPQRVNWSAMGILLGVSAMVFIGMQNTQLAAEVQRCQREFNAAIGERAAIGDENDRLSREERHWLGKSAEAISDLVKYATTPGDPKIAALPQSDPRRQAWVSAIVELYTERVEGYKQKILAVEDKQEDNERARAAHPVPPPTCGKE